MTNVKGSTIRRGPLVVSAVAAVVGLIGTSSVDVSSAAAQTKASANSVVAAQAGLGFYPGDAAEPRQMQMFQAEGQQLGVSPKYVVLFTDLSSDANFRASAWGHFVQNGSWKDYRPNRPGMVVSVPLAFGATWSPGAGGSSSNLEDVINGNHDGAYLYLAHALVDAGYPQAIIRLGWEFDGKWMPWEATHHPDLYIAAFRHVVDLFRSASSTFLIDWTGGAGVYFDGTQAYPGDRYVDVVGLDIYDLPWINVAKVLTGRQQFAAAHGKPVSYAEWGLTVWGGDHPGFIQAMYDWFASLPASGPGSLLYQSYYLGASVGSPLALNPQAAALYSRLFG